MRKTAITLGIMILVSSILCSAFFFSSGMFDMDVGYVTVENGNKVLNELNALPFIYVDEPTEISEINEIITKSIVGIEEIEIDSVSTEVIIEPTESENISFNLVGVGQGQKLFLRQSSDKIEAEVKYPKGFKLFSVSDLVLYVKIPISYSESLNVESVSGDVYAERLILNEMKIHTTSGEVFLEKVQSEMSRVDTVSGDIEAVETFIDRIDVTSGDIDLELFEVKNDVRIESVSGDVTINPTIDSSFEIDFDSVSGDLEGVSESMSGKFQVEVDTVSGDLIIN